MKTKISSNFLDSSPKRPMPQVDILKNTEELKAHIAQFETTSFISNYYYLLNTHTRTQNKVLNLKSPLRQIMYLLALFFETASTGSLIFDPVTGDSKKIEALLEKIEDGYRNNYVDSLNDLELQKEMLEKRLLVSTQTFNNYFFNGELSYIEQEVERIERTFLKFNNHILQKTGLYLQDFLDFYDLTEKIEVVKFEEIRRAMYELEIDSSFEHISNTVEKVLYEAPFPLELLYETMSKEKIDRLLGFFSCQRNERKPILYYTNDCEMMAKPIARLPENFLILPCQKQLIHSIFDFLFEICKDYSKDGRKILEARDKLLEEKTFELFDEYFDKKARILRNYYIDGQEKDLLVLYRNTAFIIECKASKYRKPYRDPEKSFDSIKTDFKNSIQKGYDQSWTVKLQFKTKEKINIQDKWGRTVDSINTNKYSFCFSIIVTGERFGQIQCDLGSLLKLQNMDDSYPWSVYVDDLETILTTFKRKDNFYGELISYITNRNKLHERVVCSDELELAGYFLMEKLPFIKKCNAIDNVFISFPDMHGIFDDLYKTGLGFKNERNLQRKLRNENSTSKALKKALRIKDSAVVKTLNNSNKTKV